MITPSGPHDCSEAIFTALSHVNSLSMKALDDCKVPIASSVQEVSSHVEIPILMKSKERWHCCRYELSVRSNNGGVEKMKEGEDDY
jgi:hypothetical protein